MEIDKEIYNAEYIVSTLLIIILSISVVSITFLTYQTRKDVREIRTHIERWANMEITQGE